MKTFASMFSMFLILTAVSFAQDTSLAVTSNGNVGIKTANPASELDVNGTLTVSGTTASEVNRAQTGDANIVPIAFGNVNADGSINMQSSTDNVSLSSHSAGTGNYYISIDGESIYYTNYTCIVTLNGGPSGQVSWNSAGGDLYIGTADNSGTATDKAFTFILFKK